MLDRETFCARFIAEMVRRTPFDAFDDGLRVADYAADTAPSYFEDQHLLDGESPEECVAADMSYWGEE